MLIGRIIGSHLCTPVSGQQFRKEWRKLRTRIMFETYYSFFHYCLLSCRYVMFRSRILSKPKWGAQVVVTGGGGGVRPPWPPSSDGTVPIEGPPEKVLWIDFCSLINDWNAWGSNQMPFSKRMWREQNRIKLPFIYLKDGRHFKIWIWVHHRQTNQSNRSKNQKWFGRTIYNTGKMWRTSKQRWLLRV